jgi:type VI secretion system protein ImpB
MAENPQHKLRRVRPPRVQIQYDVETEGAMQKIDLPFLVGVIGDLSGKPKSPLPKLEKRRFAEISRDNFNSVMAQQAPRLAFETANKLTDDNTNLKVELNFKEMADFDPARVAEQVPALKELLKIRRELDHILATTDTKGDFNDLLAEVLKNTDKAVAYAKQLGLDAQGSSTEKAKGEDKK